MTISSSSRRWAALPILLLALAWPAASQAAPEILAPHLAVRTAASGLNQPIAVAHIGFNDMLVTREGHRAGEAGRQRPGAERRARPAPSTPDPSGACSGIALHPDFPTNPGVYLYWTESSTGADTNALADVPLSATASTVRLERHRP